MARYTRRRGAARRAPARSRRSFVSAPRRATRSRSARPARRAGQHTVRLVIEQATAAPQAPASTQVERAPVKARL